VADGIRPGVGRAELAARRVIAAGAAIVVVLVVVAGTMLAARDGDRNLPLWFIALLAAVAGVFVLTGLCAPWLPPRGLRVGSGAAACGYLLVLVVFVPAAAAAPAVERAPWALSASAAATAAALLAWGARAAWVVLAASLVAVGAFRLVVGGLDPDGLVNDAQAALAATVVCVIGAHLLATTRALDEAAAAAASSTATAAAAHGRLAARTRAASLVHDEVLAVLTLVVSALPVPPGRLAAQARRAARAVTDIADPVDVAGSGTEPGGAVLVQGIAAVAARAGAVLRVSGAADPTLPDGVAGALLAATTQALDNSVRHAGPGARRIVTVEAAASGVRIEVADDGRGFDPDALPENRLGVRASILERVRVLPGGRAEVVSAPGTGTQVLLGWQAPQAADLAVPSVPMPGRFDLIAIAVVFLTGQAVSALAAALAGPRPWVPPLLLLLLSVAAEILRRGQRTVPSPRRTAAFVAAVTATVVVGLLLQPLAFAPAWFVTASAFLLVALVLRLRLGAAVVGLALLLTAVLAAGILTGAAPGTVALVMARPALLVALAVLLVVAVERMRRRTALLHRRAVATTRRAAWDAAAGAELSQRAAELRRDVLPVLERIAAGEPLDEQDRRRCLAVEGQLRDAYRAGALRREPLIAAIRAARERGVDVVVLDDSGGAPPDAATLELVAAWMAEHLGEARRRAVARLAPSGRAEIATLTVDGEAHGYAAVPAQSSSSFHGE